MVVLESCPKHNMVPYLEKTEGNAEFHEFMDFLARISIHHALTVSPVVSTTFVEQFWMPAKSKIINNVWYITAKVAGKPVSISEASIRSDLLFNDADGIDSLPNQAIFDAIQLMGYEEDLTVLTFNKALFSPQWRCKEEVIMYPQFISIFLDKQLVNVPVPLDHFLVNALRSKVFSFMVKKGKHFSRKITPLFASMLVQSTEDEGATSERPSVPHPTPSPPYLSEANVEPQSDPSSRPSLTPYIPDSIPEVSGGNQEGQSSSDRSLSGTEDGMMGLEDKILVPKPPRNCARCARCGTPVDGPYCHGCALLRKKFKEDLFTYCVENEFFKDLQDASESSNDNTNIVNAPQEPFVGNQDPRAIQKKEEEKRMAEEQAAKERYWKIPICDDDDDDYTIAITPVLPTKEPVNSLSMGDEHLDTIPATESDEVWQSSRNL
ncbi:hypothetical protein Tco_0629112 [Tanacetum coccineum]|uniref:Uncharacterized protein n=1 Tax=Tanacetum coccineum TaxID=301880 RepID=A0ABQ4WS74_9ASTR